MAFSLFQIIKGLLITEENSLTPKQIEITPGGTAGTKTTVVSSQTTNKTITLPDATDTLVGKATTDTLTNKSIDADLNTITNIENADIKAGAAIDATKIANGTVSNTEFQYLDGASSNIQNQLTTNATGLSDHLADTVDAHDASAISFVPTGTIASTDVQTAVAEVASEAATNLSTHASTATGVHGVAGNVVGTTDTQTLSNKTISGAANTLTNVPTSALTGQVDIAHGGTGAATKGAAFDALSPNTTKGDITLHNGTTNVRQAVGTDGQVLVVDSTQSTGVKFAAITGVKNYITNEGAESTVSGWSTFADGATLVDGTGGSPTATITRSTSSPLRGNASLLYTAGTLGDGVSFDFTIDDADKAKVLNISMDYQLSGTITDGDYQCYIYDRTNSVLIQPAGYKFSGTSGTNYSLRATFQSTSSSTSYRLIIYQSVSTSVTLKFDNVVVGPSTVTTGAYIGDWQPVTVTGSWTGTATYTAKSRRVGDSEEYDVLVSLSGLATSAGLLITLPRTIDTSKLSAAGAEPVVGYGRALDLSTASYPAIVYQNSSTQVGVNVINAAGTYGTQVGNTQAIPFTYGSGDSVHVTFRVPIVGWGTSQVLSSDSSESRVVAARYTNSAAQTIAAGVTAITGWTLDFDSHSTFNTSTGVYTVQVPGRYRVSAQLTAQTTAWTTGASKYMEMKLAGTKTGSLCLHPIWASQTSYVALTGSTIQDYRAGDTISISWDNQSGTSSTLIANAAYNHLSIERISGPSQIAASESVNARYTRATTQSMSTTVSIVDFSTKDFDTHGAVTTGASWRFTAPTAMKVSVSIGAYCGGTVGVVFLLYKNGSSYARLCEVRATEAIKFINGGTDVSLLAGEYIDIRGATESSTMNIGGSADLLHVSIKKVGN